MRARLFVEVWSVCMVLFWVLWCVGVYYLEVRRFRAAQRALDSQAKRRAGVLRGEAWW